MSTTSQSKTCPKCAGHIPADSPEGLCPRCLLLGVALPTETGKMPASKGTPPTLEELSAAFPNLELLELIGQGGMGFVFKARQPKLNRFVALKILPQSLAADPAFAERFIREGRLLARLNHPQIVAVHDFGQANGFFYLLMEFVDGVNLRQALKAGRMEPAQALAIVPKICDALQYAHSEGVLHRDIKPENILLDTKGRVKIADFGIAKLVGERAAEGELTTGGASLGTPHYMAPEQLEKPGEVDHRADVYSLGVVFYEMLTGELPIGRFVAPSEKSRVDPRLDEVVLRTLEKERERRTQSAGEVKSQVETITSSKAPVEKTEVIPQEPDTSAKTRLRSTRMVLAITLLVILLLGTGLVLFLSNRTQQNAGKQPVLTTGEPFAKQIVFTRATNQSVGDSNDLRNVVVWSDTTVEPGEMLLAMVRRPEGSLEEARALLFTRTGLHEIKTSTALSWFFGPLHTPGFDEADAETAAAQLSEKVLDKPLLLSAGQPYEVFSVTNISGAALKGYVQYMRSVPEPAPVSGSPAAKPHAIVHIRGYAPYVRSVDYSVKLPPGYALRGTANAGEVSTHFLPSLKPPVDTVALQASRGEYHTTWFPPPVAPGTIALNPERLRAQEAVLGKQLRELKDRGPLQITPGEPFQVFAITNLNGEVHRGFFELVSAEDNARTNNSINKPSADAPAVIADATGLTNVSRRSAARPALPASAPTHRGPPKVDPATGLPLPLGNPGAVRVDPATGLPTPVRPPVSSKILPQGPTDVLSEARELTANGNYAAALERYLSYYERSRSSSTTRPPLVSALSDWVALGEKFPKARQALIDIQERGTRTFSEGQGSAALFAELADVNNALKEEAKTWILFKALALADPSLAQQCYLYAEELLVQRGEYDLCLKFLGNVQLRYEALLVTFSAERNSINNYLQPDHQAVQQTYVKGRTSTSTSPLSPAATNVWTRIKQAREDRFAQQICRWAEILLATGSRDEAGRLCKQALTVLDHPQIQSGIKNAEERISQNRASFTTRALPTPHVFAIPGPPPVNTNITGLSLAIGHWQPASAQGQKPDLDGIRKEAKTLAAEGKYEEALQRHIWFHNQALEHDPNQRGVRLSYALADWFELGRKYPKAKAALLEIRDWNTRTLTEGRGTVQEFKDTAAINRQYGCEDATLSLFKAIQQRDPVMARKCYDTAEEVLVQKGEYDLCYAALGNYLEKFAAYRQEWEKGRAWETNISAKLSSIPNRSGGPSFVPPPYYDNHFVESTRRLIEVLVGTGHATEAAGLQDQAVAALDDARLRSAVADAKKRIGQ